MALKLNPKRDALFLDIDGTLLDIAAKPEKVLVPVTLTKHLKKLHERLDGALALVSGRTIENIDKLFLPLRLPAIGVHGLEWRETADGSITTSHPLDQKIRDKISYIFHEYPGVFVENKVYSIAVHYRQAPQFKEQIYDVLTSTLHLADAELELLKGKMVFELIRTGYGKKPAIERFMRLPVFADRRPVFFGDDETDKPAITAFARKYGTGICVGADVELNLGIFYRPKIVRSWLADQIA